MRREMHLDYLMRMYIFSPLEKNKYIFWSLPAIHLFSNSHFSPTFQISLTFHKIPRLFPDLEKISFSVYFSLTVATPSFCPIINTLLSDADREIPSRG